ncbi:hypothetical protein BJY04DRAFT_200677 [Aspergillus karnatakaensis]|uniref:uncharacterized protein n=1 Tax=Aspergillus karnatakaensis TaxID=1810916 RepID=UPI003CCE4D95
MLNTVALSLGPPRLLPPETEATIDWRLAPVTRPAIQGHVVPFLRGAEWFRRSYRSRTLSEFKLWRQLGWFIWDSWRMYSVGLCERPWGVTAPTPYDEMLEGVTGSVEGSELDIDYAARWFAIAGEKKPVNERPPPGGN